MKAEQDHALIELLDCDLDIRPKAAPVIDQLLPRVRGTKRIAATLHVEFDPGAAETLEAFVAAERLCCAGIGWEIQRGPPLVLRISANDAKIRAIESLWNNKQT